MTHTTLKRTPLTTLVYAITIGTLLIASGYAAAQAPAGARDPAATKGIDKAQARQQARIDQGVASGKITPAEKANLQQGQANIANAKAAAKADGKVTKDERKQLKQMQRDESRKIESDKR